MDDDALTRARRALRGTDPELDLTRVYAESRDRARDAGAPGDGWADAEGVEILLRDGSPDARRRRLPARRAAAIAWAAAAAAVLAVSLAGPPALRALPGSAPASSAPAPTDPAAGPSPSPTVGLTPAQVVTTAARAMAGEGCGVKTSSTFGDKPTVRFDDAEPSGAATPKPIRLDSQPLQALQAVAVRTTLGLSALEGADHRLDDDLTIEDLDGLAVIRIRIDPADTIVLGGDVTRIDLLVDPTTWLPRAAETRAESDQGDEYLVRSEFSWMTCDGPSRSPVP